MRPVLRVALNFGKGATPPLSHTYVTTSLYFRRIFSSVSARAALYNQAERMFMSAEPVVPLYNQVVAWLAKPSVHGVGQSAQYMLKWDLGSISR